MAKKVTKKETKKSIKKVSKKVSKKVAKSSKEKNQKTTSIKKKSSQTIKKVVSAEDKQKEAPKKTKNIKVSTVPKAKTAHKKATTMAELLAAQSVDFVIPKEGQTITGQVVAKDRKTLRVDIGAKTEALVVDNEFDFAKDYIEQLKIGDKVEGIVVSSENDKGQVILSLKSQVNDVKWEFFEQAMESGDALSAKGLEVNKGGLIVLVNNVRGFVPSSQFGRQYVGQIRQLKGQKFDVKVIEVDREKNRLIFSERFVSEAKQIAQKDQALNRVKEGKIYEGVVSGVMPFGLFVTVEVPITEKKVKKDDIGYIEGLVHISEISWEKVKHPKDFHQVGDRIKVKVLGIDPQSNKLNLSIKRLHDDPWKNISHDFSVGKSVKGVVSRIVNFGVFVKLKPGVDGLIHSTKLDPNQELKVGDEVSVVVESVNEEQRRMSLSLVLTEVPMGYK